MSEFQPTTTPSLPMRNQSEQPKRQASRLRLALFCLLPTALLFVLAEGVLRVSTPEWLFIDVRTDAYWKTMLRHKIKHPPPQTRNIDWDADLGWRMKRSFQGDKIHHNSHGFRDHREFSGESEGARFFAIGDSMTYGLGVPNEKTYCALLEQMMSAEVVNAGVNAYGADQASLMWEQEGKPLKPDRVILGYYVDDFYRNGLTVRDWPKPYFVQDRTSPGFHLEGVPVPELDIYASTGALRLRTRVRVLDFVSYVHRRVRRKIGLLDTDYLHGAAELSQHILTRLHRSTEQSGARLLVVVIGEQDDHSPDYHWIEEEIVDFCTAKGIDVINLAEAMRLADYRSYYTNGHLSEQGHRFTAETIAHRLTTLRNPLPSSSPQS